MLSCKMLLSCILVLCALNLLCKAECPDRLVRDFVTRSTEGEQRKEAIAKQIARAIEEERYLFWKVKQMDQITNQGKSAVFFSPSLLFVVTSQETVDVSGIIEAIGAIFAVHTTGNELKAKLPDLTLVSESEGLVQAEAYLEELLRQAVCFDCKHSSPTAIVLGLKEALIISRTDTFMKILRPRIVYVSRHNVAKVCFLIDQFSSK